MTDVDRWTSAVATAPGDARRREPGPALALLPDGPTVIPDPGSQWIPAAQSLAAHLALLGPRPRGDSSLLDEIEMLGLTGRGGGHFPAGRKWRAVIDGVRRTHRTPVVVANAAEGEPASAKDRALLTRRPHLVLDGLVCAGEAVGALDVIVWAHQDDDVLRRVLSQALGERRHLGEPAVRLVGAPPAYLSGETSAVVRALSGGPALPFFSREHATYAGVGGRPTLVHNVETLARVGLAARTGAAGASRTSLVTVVTSGRRTAVEVSERATVAQALTAGGWPTGRPARAVLVGGYGGRWLPWSVACDVRVNQPALRAAGASLGAGVLAPLPVDRCGLAETARVLRFLAASGARQCGPCLFGLPVLAGAVDRLARGEPRRGDLRDLDRWAAEVHGRGGCHHPDGAVTLLRSALDVFADDVARHRRGMPCAGADASPLLPIPDRTPA